MSTAWLRRLLAAGVIGSMLLCIPASAVATVTGGCSATGTASGSAGSDITNDAEWDLKSTDVVGGQGTAPSLMTSATLYAYALGLKVPVASGSGKGDTSGSVDSISLDTFSKLGKIFVVAGSATGPAGSCDGQILIVLDDVDALFTVLGGGGILLAVIFLGAMLMTIGRPGCASKVLGGLCGGFGLASAAIAMSQFNVISPTSPIGAAIALIGLVLGFLLAGSRAPKPPAPTPSAAHTVNTAVGIMEPGDTAGDSASAAPTPSSGTPPASSAPTPWPRPISPPPAPTNEQVGQGAVDLIGSSATDTPLPNPEPPPPSPSEPGVNVRPNDTSSGPTDASGNPLT